MDLSHVITAALALLAGAVAALKVWAPKTANKTDDKVLERLEAIEKLVTGLAPPK